MFTITIFYRKCLLLFCLSLNPDFFTACTDGWFGAGCKNKCGFCSGPDVCSNINGNCPGTCSDGYTGTQCITRKLSFKRQQSFLIIFNYSIHKIIITLFLVFFDLVKQINIALNIIS